MNSSNLFNFPWFITGPGSQLHFHLPCKI